MKVISLVGALQALQEKGFLKKVKEVCGVSAGAWLAFMIAAGTSYEKIKTLVFDLDFSVVRNLTTEGMLGFPETFGVDDGSSLVKFLESIIKVVLKLDPRMSFADLRQKSRINFRCWASDLQTWLPREFSADLTPNVKIVDALRASMSLPFYFSPVADPVTGNLLGDGGIHGNLPMCHLSDGECMESLALGFCYKNPGVKRPEISDLMAFSNAVLSCIIKDRTAALLERWCDRVLQIPVDEYPSWNFEASREDRISLFQQGREATETWLHKPVLRKVFRRRSF